MIVEAKLAIIAKVVTKVGFMARSSMQQKSKSTLQILAHIVNGCDFRFVKSDRPTSFFHFIGLE